MKKCMFFITFVILIMLFPLSVSAEEENLEQKFLDNTGSYLDDSITDEASDYFEDNDITLEDSSSLTKMSIGDVLKYIIKNIKYSISRPMRLLGITLAITILIAVVESLNSENSSTSLSKVFDIIGVLLCVTVLYKYIADSIQLTAKTLQDGSNFMICYVPVFASIVASSGNITSAGVYNSLIVLVSQYTVKIATTVLVPMMGIYMAMSIVEVINPGISLSGFSNGIKKATIWMLGLIMTLFVGMISVQSIAGASADSVAIRAGKFVASSFIPVIGSAISDAYTTVRGSLGLLRSGIGIFGIIILLLTVLPPLISVTVTKLAVVFSCFVSDILGVKKVNMLLKSISSVLSIAISLMISFSLILIISTTVLMLVGLNM